MVIKLVFLKGVIRLIWILVIMLLLVIFNTFQMFQNSKLLKENKSLKAKIDCLTNNNSNDDNKNESVLI